MAAINIHVGTQSPADRKDGNRCALGAGLGNPRACVPDLSASHNGQTRMVWIRRSLEQLLSDRRYWIADGASVGKKGPERAELYIVIDRPFRKNDIPWMPAAVEEISAFALVGEAGKMRCPTWDLPAGSPVVGGACPGATAGQSTVPPEIRAKAGGEHVKLRESICQICYAEGGQYASPHVQAGEILRHWWCREMMASAQGQAEWVRVVDRAFRGLSWAPQRQIGYDGRPVIPVRVHSSGDFFSHAYARSWIELANRLPELTFWAPTRTWAAPGWKAAWAQMLRELRQPNFVLRPSAYHTDDPAPLSIPWGGGLPFTANGTTAVYRDKDMNFAAGRDGMAVARGGSVDPRYDWPCQAYAVVDDRKTCANALAPDGRVGCRACWTQPGIRVNYTAH